MPPLPELKLDLSLTKDDFDGMEQYTFLPFEERWDGDGPMPIHAVDGLNGVPTLRHIHPRHWVRILSPLDRARRSLARSSGGLTQPELSALFDVFPRLPPPAIELVAQTGQRLGTRPDRARQVNMRLDADEYEDLVVVAEMVNLKPTQIARMLVLTGVRNMLAEHGASYVASRR